jgi:tyrosine-protein kinase Etk/Wzc
MTDVAEGIAARQSDRALGVSAESRAPTSAEDVSLIQLLTPLVRRWRLIAGTAIVCAAVAAVVLFLQRPVYTAQTSFTPETPNNASLTSSLAGLAGLAGQMGISVPSAGSVSPDFFAMVLHSREILRSTLRTEFADPTSDSSRVRRSLLDILKVRGKTPEQRLQEGTRRLEHQTEVVIDRRTGIVSLAVEMPSPDLAAAVANLMVEQLNRFNLERRQSQSREERRFSGERLATAERELRAAEQAHLAFLQRNRVYTESPLLNFEANRLSREVQLKQEVFLTLTKSYEQARIAEVRDTPVLTVIDSAVAPVKRTRPRRMLGVLIAFMVGGLIGTAAAYVVDLRARGRWRGRSDYRELQEAWEEAKVGASS